eukprot:scaffold130111_cov67-Phaeocystis_antarctica.AAC.4
MAADTEPPQLLHQFDRVSRRVAPPLGVLRKAVAARGFGGRQGVVDPQVVLEEDLVDERRELRLIGDHLDEALLEAERGRVDVDLQHDEVCRPRVR